MGWKVWGVNTGGSKRFSLIQTCPRNDAYSGCLGSFPRGKRPGRGVDHPPLSNLEVRTEQNYNSIPLRDWMACYGETERSQGDASTHYKSGWTHMLITPMPHSRDSWLKFLELLSIPRTPCDRWRKPPQKFLPLCAKTLLWYFGILVIRVIVHPLSCNTTAIMSSPLLGPDQPRLAPQRVRNIDLDT